MLVFITEFQINILITTVAASLLL